MYADMLSRAFADRGLGVIAISKSRPRRLAEFLWVVSVPVVIDDDSLSPHKLFGSREWCGGTVLIDTTGVTRWISAYLAPGGTMRQVVEGQLARPTTRKTGSGQEKR